MSADIALTLIGIIGLTINCTTMFLTFPCRRSLSFSIGAIILFTAAFYVFTSVTGTMGVELSGMRGIIYLPLMIWLFKGMFFQKVFAFFLQFLLTVLQGTLAAAIVSFFAPYGSSEYYVAFLAVLLAMYTVYITLVFFFGRRVFQKIFAHGRQAEWAAYSFGAVFSYVFLIVSWVAPNSEAQRIMLMLFILWSFGVLCLAIITTNEKSRQRYEAELVRGVISSGREHYQKMNKMYDELRVLRHDFKYHLSVVRKTLRSGNADEIDKYLDCVEAQLSETELTIYCENPIINALLSSYAERCAKLNIRYDVKIALPEDISIPNYEMCIILGNLLENALEACQKIDDGRLVELSVKRQGEQLAVMVRNSFDGVVTEENGQPASAKKDGGFGLRSVQAVAARYGGYMLPKWEGEIFTTYVLTKV